MKNEEKIQKCQELGANLAINYKEADFVAQVNSFTESPEIGPGVDIIMDMVGADYLA